MFRPIALEVQSTPDGVFFVFPQPLSVISLTVTGGTGEEMWSLVADEMKPVQIEGSTMSVVPMEQATPQLLELLQFVQRRADLDLAKQGPFKPLVSQIQYGVAPEGYRAERAAAALGTGSHTVTVFSQQGYALAAFQAVVNPTLQVPVRNCAAA